MWEKQGAGVLERRISRGRRGRHKPNERNERDQKIKNKTRYGAWKMRRAQNQIGHDSAYHERWSQSLEECAGTVRLHGADQRAQQSLAHVRVCCVARDFAVFFVFEFLDFETLINARSEFEKQ